MLTASKVDLTVNEFEESPFSRFNPIQTIPVGYLCSQFSKENVYFLFLSATCVQKQYLLVYSSIYSSIYNQTYSLLYNIQYIIELRSNNKTLFSPPFVGHI